MSDEMLYKASKLTVDVVYACCWWFKCKLLGFIRLPYAFKMRQDYLSTSYLDQKYLPSERSETREI